MFRSGLSLCSFLFVTTSFVGWVNCAGSWDNGMRGSWLKVSIKSTVKVSDNGDAEEEIPEHDKDPDFAIIDDMILSPTQYDVLFQNLSNRVESNQAVRIWPNAVVPYVLDNNFSKLQWTQAVWIFVHKLFLCSLAAAEKSLIRTAQNVIQKQSCVKFERIYNTNKYKDYVYVKSGHGCASTVGFWGGRQVLYLQKAVKACKIPYSARWAH